VGLSTGVNAPFAGAYVPLKYYQADARVASVMLEIRRDVYMDERSLAIDGNAFEQLRVALQKLVGNRRS
jgi:N-formylglutamate amidohydrolase